MFSTSRRLTRAALLLTPLLALPATPATANQAWHAVTYGSGIVTPGVTLVPTVQTAVTFTATLVLGAGSAGEPLVATNCTFSGSSSIGETLIEGKGSGTLGGCVGTNVTGNVNYERTLGVLTISGSLTVNGSLHAIDRGVFQIVPTSAEPVTTYQLAGEISLS